MPTLEEFQKWGRKGGKRSLKTMTPEQRIARARKAGLAKRKTKPK